MMLVIAVGALFAFSWFLGEEEGTGGFLRELAEVLWQEGQNGLPEVAAPPDTPSNLPERRTGGMPGLPPISGADWYQIYFTAPTCPDEAARTGGLDATIAADLAKASQQVDIAAFELNALPIVDALIALEQQGVLVRVVTDSDYAGESSIRRLRRHGVSVVEDKRSGLMHNKFIVIDQRVVWTGSLNFTSNGVYCNNNNVVRMESVELATNYRTEMDEMYEGRSFGPDSPNNTPHERITLAGVEVESYFAPERELVNTLARAVARAEDEILVMAFSFTSPEIGEAMLGRAEAGVRVQAIFETTGSETLYSYFPQLGEIGLNNIEVRQDGNPRSMHHKVIIVDRRTVVFGSFNFSESANRKNDENVLIVHDPAFADHFVREFDAVWTTADAGGSAAEQR